MRNLVFAGSYLSIRRALSFSVCEQALDNGMVDIIYIYIYICTQKKTYYIYYYYYYYILYIYIIIIIIYILCCVTSIYIIYILYNYTPLRCASVLVLLGCYAVISRLITGLPWLGGWGGISSHCTTWSVIYINLYI